VNKKVLILVSVKSKKPITTVKTVSNSQYGNNVESFSFLYANCSNHSERIQKIADKNNNPANHQVTFSNPIKKYQNTHNNSVIIAQIN
jgi:hypothetical protein